MLCTHYVLVPGNSLSSHTFLRTKNTDMWFREIIINIMFVKG